MVHKWTSAKELLAAIETLNLNTMTQRESGKLHEACNHIRIEIEEFWVKWDDPKPR